MLPGCRLPLSPCVPCTAASHQSAVAAAAAAAPAPAQFQCEGSTPVEAAAGDGGGRGLRTASVGRRRQPADVLPKAPRAQRLELAPSLRRGLSAPPAAQFPRHQRPIDVWSRDCRQDGIVRRVAQCGRLEQVCHSTTDCTIF